MSFSYAMPIGKRFGEMLKWRGRLPDGGWVKRDDNDDDVVRPFVRPAGRPTVPSTRESSEQRARVLHPSSYRRWHGDDEALILHGPWPAEAHA